MTKMLETIEKYLLFTIVFAFPLFFLNIFPNTFETSKLLFLLVSVLTLSLFKIIKLTVSDSFHFRISKLDIFVVLFSVITLLSSLLTSTNKIDAFFMPGVSSFIILGTVLYFFVNQLNEKGRDSLKLAVILSAATVSIIQIVSLLIGKNFTTFGNLVSPLIFALGVLPFAFYKVIKSEKLHLKIIGGLSAFVIFISSFYSLYSILPGKQTTPRLPSLKISWEIAIDSLKASPLLGVGPTNFLQGFNKFRPITSNSTSEWATKFGFARNTPLQVLTEMGILGLISFGLMFFVALKKIKIENAGQISLFIVLLISLFFPISGHMFPILLILFSLSSETWPSSTNFSSKFVNMLIAVPFLLAIGTLGFFSYKAFSAEYIFGQSVKSFTLGEGVKSYDSVNKAISINRYVDRYHLVAAEVNIAIANALSKKEKVTEEEKKTIASLIQQSIKEGRAAVAASPRKSSNWESLGNIYKNIMSFAKEADKFAIQSYSQAIFLDPINPNLRIKLGGIYFAGSKYEEAVKIFELAVVAKPDLANSHYNLAVAYKNNKQLDKAKEQMNLTLSLLGKDSKDYEIAQKELQNIEGLTIPESSPAPAIEPKIEIPQDENQAEQEVNQQETSQENNSN